MKISTAKNPLTSPEMTKKITIFVPPDGGWGWMVLLGIALCNIFNMSMLSLFSLLYGDALEEMGHKTQGAATILSVNLFVSNFGGPLAGALVKMTSPRIAAVIGACFCTSGIFFSGFSTNIWHLVVSFGVLLGLGLDFVSNASFVAINSYFKKKKSRAVGLATVGSNIGQMFMPHLARYLLENYGFRGTCLLLSSLSFHGVAGCLLLQPVERHMKKIVKELTVDETLHLLQDEQKYIDLAKISTPNEETSKIDKQLNVNYDCEENANVIIETEKKPGFLRKLYDLFGIALLSELRFVIIVIGTALITTSTINFSLLYPLFLQKAASMDKQQTANCMTALASADMIGRLFLPVLQDKFKLKARWMLILTALWVIITRQILAYQTDLAIILVLSIFYGFGKSLSVINKNIAISENCRMEQVPAAVGLGMFSMGLLAPPIGYFLGWIRDYTGSYIICISAQNCLLIIMLVLWLPDMLYIYTKEKKKNNAGEFIKAEII